MSLERHDRDRDSQLLCSLTTVNWSTFCPLYRSTSPPPHQLTSLLLGPERPEGPPDPATEVTASRVSVVRPVLSVFQSTLNRCQ